MSGIHVGEVLIALVFLLLGSFVAGTESVVGSIPEARLRAMMDDLEGRRYAQLDRYLRDPSRLLTDLLAFRVTALIVASVMATNAVAHGRDAAWKLVLVITVLALAYGSITALFAFAGRARIRSFAPLALTLTRPLEILTTPVALPLRWLGHAIEKRITHRHHSEPPPITEREVEYVVEQAEEQGTLDAKRGQMLQNVLELKDLTARDVKVPRTGVRAVDATTGVTRALAMVTEEGHSRVPVFRGQIDNIVGVLHVKDLFLTTRPGGVDGRSVPPGNEVTVESLARKPAMFVAESQNVLGVLRDMQARRTHMAMVVDEFGAIAGLVTLEDILERLVGDIQDEHDTDEAPFEEISAGRYLASAAIPVTRLGELLEVEFPEVDEYASLGGFLAERAGKVPGVGTVVRWQGLVFTVREGDKRHATKVEIERESRVSDRPVAAAE